MNSRLTTSYEVLSQVGYETSELLHPTAQNIYAKREG
jgi:hypothetical protein